MPGASTSDGSKGSGSVLNAATPALVSGAVQAVVFNPFDRALYLRVHHRRRRFLNPRNFERPFQGFANAAAYRTIVGASYVFWQDNCRRWLNNLAPSIEAAHPTANAVLIGFFAGALNGLALNNLQAIKFRMWSADAAAAAATSGGGAAAAAKRPTFFGTALEMYRAGGVRVFFRGCVITMMRDSVFGIFYEGLRHSVLFRAAVDTSVNVSLDLMVSAREAGRAALGFDNEFKDEGGALSDEQKKALASSKKRLLHHDRHPHIFITNLFAAVAATVASSPLNYLRSLAYGVPPGSVSLGFVELAKSLVIQLQYVYRNGESYAKITYQDHPASPSSRNVRAAIRALNAKLNVGWGSLRVGLGMAVGQAIFSFVNEAMHA